MSLTCQHKLNTISLIAEAARVVEPGPSVIHALIRCGGRPTQRSAREYCCRGAGRHNDRNIQLGLSGSQVRDLMDALSSFLKGIPSRVLFGAAAAELFSHGAGFYDDVSSARMVMPWNGVSGIQDDLRHPDGRRSVKKLRVGDRAAGKEIVCQSERSAANHQHRAAQ